MKKSILILAAALLLGTVGASFAQSTTSVATVKNTSASVQHPVLVHIPSVVMLRLNGTGTYDVSFTPTVTQIRNAGTSGTVSVAPDSSTTFGSLEGFTNAVGDVNVTTKITSAGSGTGMDATVMGEIMLNGTALASSPTLTITGTGNVTAPTWQTLITDSSAFTFALTGTETPGDYTYTVTYSAAVP